MRASDSDSLIKLSSWRGVAVTVLLRIPDCRISTYRLTSSPFATSARVDQHVAIGMAAEAV